MAYRRPAERSSDPAEAARERDAEALARLAAAGRARNARDARAAAEQAERAMRARERGAPARIMGRLVAGRRPLRWALQGGSVGVVVLVAVVGAAIAIALGVYPPGVLVLSLVFFLSVGWVAALPVGWVATRLFAPGVLRREQERLAALPFEVSGYFVVVDHPGESDPGLAVKVSFATADAAPETSLVEGMLGHLQPPKSPDRVNATVRREGAAVFIDIGEGFVLVAVLDGLLERVLLPIHAVHTIERVELSAR